MTETATGQKRLYPRISLPKGMFVAWHGGDLQLFSRVRTISVGGLFISVPNPPPVGTKLRLAFEVPGGNVRAEAVVRNIPRRGYGPRVHEDGFERQNFVAEAAEAITTVMQSLATLASYCQTFWFSR